MMMGIHGCESLQLCVWTQGNKEMSQEMTRTGDEDKLNGDVMYGRDISQIYYICWMRGDRRHGWVRMDRFGCVWIGVFVCRDTGEHENAS